MRRLALFVSLVGLVAGCGSGNKSSNGENGGAGGFFTGSGGTDQGGGFAVAGGTSVFDSGGAVGAGGLTFGAGGFSPGTGGFEEVGGAPGNGGTDAGLQLDGGPTSDASTDGSAGTESGGSTGSGGASGTGGASAGGGTASAGGTSANGGTSGAGGGAASGGAADAGSGAAPRCGDGVINVAGEQCDDGNETSGDGCSSKCKLENTCGTATPITLAGTGTAAGSITGDTSDAVSRVLPAQCDESVAGAGPDALYSFTLDRARTVTLTLNANFDGILRTYTTACNPSYVLNEPGGDACSNTAVGHESMTFPDLAAGTYYAVVDGAGASDKGTYSLGVSAVCEGLDGVRIVELGIGTTDYVVLRNMSDCPADLSSANVFFDDSVAAGLTTPLSGVTLAPGDQLRIQENLGASTPGAIDAGGDIPFEYDRGGSVLLCKGDCSTGTNVLDVVSFADGDPSTLDPPPAPPAPVTFAFPLTGINAANQDTKSWVRVGTTGKYPNFTGGDFCTGTPNVPFGVRLEEVFVGDADYITMKNHADCAVGIQPFQVNFQTQGVSTSIESVLDSRLLGSGATVYLSEPPNQTGDISTGVPIANTGDLAGSVRLCFGSCNSAGTTVDVVAWNGSTASFPALPEDLSFTPDGLTAIGLANQDTTSYLRAALKGNDPRFLESDWKTGTPSR